MLLSPEGGALEAPDCLLRREERECSVSLQDHRLRSAPINRILENVASEFSNVKVIDPTKLLCRGTRCSPMVDGIVAYTDYLHLTTTMSHALAGYLEPYLDWLTADRPRQP
jgi:hypothetical protein